MVEIAIMGLGIVGGGVVDVLTKNAEAVAAKVGEKVHIKYILDIKDLSAHPMADRVVTDINIILNDPQVTLVAELMGGSHPAYEYSLACLQSGKHVVTSNKEVVANYGDELMQQALENGVRYLFEASVGGGIPVIRPMTLCLAANHLNAVSGILNGTTNFILTKMFTEGVSFDAALRLAQENGYAERDPSADVKGIDTCRKIVILAALAEGKLFSPNLVLTKGIEDITKADVDAAECMGGTIRLIGKYEKQNDKTLLMVAPFVVPAENPLYSVQDVYNAISVRGDAVGDVMFYGRGAGNLPTASAVVADVIDALIHPTEFAQPFIKASAGELLDPTEEPFSYCVRCDHVTLDTLKIADIMDGMYCCTYGDTEDSSDSTPSGVCFKTARISYKALCEKMKISGLHWKALPILD